MNNSPVYRSFSKSPFKSIKHSSYFDVYEKLFLCYKDKPVVFIEIGVLNGGSLFMWRDYFGKKAQIIGIDLNPEARRWQKYGFDIFIGDQANPLFWQQVIKKYPQIDVVLDDGGHTYEQQIMTTELLKSHVKDGGLIVIEDTHTSYQNGFGFKCVSFLKYVQKKMNHLHYRLNSLNKETSEKDIWNIQCFESFVVFEIDREKIKHKTIEVSNAGKTIEAHDFRYTQNKLTERYINFAKKYFKFLEKSKITRNLGRGIKYVLLSWSNIKSYLRTRKYFK
jgi:hypothetical protein